MKIFSTQLQGVFRKITENEEENIEDGSRLLAQGAAASGNILIMGTPSMKGLASTLAIHEDSPSNVLHVPHIKDQKIETFDRALLLMDKGEETDLVSLIKPFRQADVPVVIIGPSSDETSGISLEPTDIWINTHVHGGIVPDDKGNRVGSPSALCTLFAGQLLYLNMKEILDEWDE